VALFGIGSLMCRPCSHVPCMCHVDAMRTCVDTFSPDHDDTFVDESGYDFDAHGA
jgi:hypothetical protein